MQLLRLTAIPSTEMAKVVIGLKMNVRPKIVTIFWLKLIVTQLLGVASGTTQMSRSVQGTNSFGEIHKGSRLSRKKRKEYIHVLAFKN
mmetsp:Transcript_17738/g.24647  ORF Transcript_17738/g.24647 Transcript_17738/m.24647 type:complete len:88 (+) Transcript_17738:476-739(+)